MQRKFTSLLIFTLISVNIIAQSWTHYFTDFPISCSYLDKDNGKWFGTEFGIQHIDKDGNRKNYNTATTPLIVSNLISCINQDNQGKLWFGTSDGGISVFNGTSWQNYNKQNSNLATNNIGRIKFDKNGNAWITSSDTVIYKFDGTNWTSLAMPQHYKNKVIANDLTFDNLGNLWIATTYGIIKQENNGYTIYRRDSSKLSNYSNFSSIEKDLSGNICTAGYDGLLLYDGATWKNIGNSTFGPKKLYVDKKNVKWVISGDVYSYDNASWQKFDLSNLDLDLNRINTVLVDNSEAIWFGKNRGGLAISSQSVWYFYKFGNTDLTDNLITDIKFADDNNLWMSTDYGVCHYNGTWNKLDSINEVIDYAQLRDIEIDANKNIWFGTALGQKGVVHYDQNKWIIHDKTNSGFASNLAISTYFDKDQRLWASVAPKIYYYENNRWIEFNTAASNYLTKNPPYNMIQRENKDLWFYFPNGIAIYNGIKWDSVTTFGANSPIPYSSINDIIEDKNQHVWLAQRDGATKFDGTQWIHYSARQMNLPDGALVTTVFESRSNGIYVGSTKGFANFHNNVWKTSKDFNAPLDMDITRFAEDSKGNLWISTNKQGLFTFKQNIVNITDQDITNAIHLYPNPADQFLNFDEQIQSYSILNFDGKILQQNNNLNASKIDVSKLQSGIYILNANTANGTHSQKFVKE